MEHRIKCPLCDGISGLDNWNAATIVAFGGDVVFLNEEEAVHAEFTCPACDENVDGVRLINQFEEANQ